MDKKMFVKVNYVYAGKMCQDNEPVANYTSAVVMLEKYDSDEFTVIDVMIYHA